MRGLMLALALAVPAAAPADSSSQVFGSAGESAPLYDRLESARQAALAGAFISVTSGQEAVFGNPAGLAGTRDLSVSLHHESWLADIYGETAVVAAQVEPGLGMGGYAHITEYGTFDVRDSNGQRQGQSSAQDMAAGLAMGYGLGGLSAGLGVRVVKQELMGENSAAMAFDGGLVYRGHGLHMGFAAVNVGTSLDGSQGAESLRAGVARRWDLDEGMALEPGVGLSWEPQGLARAQLGVELGLQNGMALRVGYEQPFTDTMISGMQGLTLGLGFDVAGLTVDYAYLPYGDLGAAHCLSVTWSSPGPKKA
ncbi:MAG TPA: PorV/PorQ family protein [bacterium]|jgi:hypothetical protein|nr:PorV/PorQ family protein [bacterium]